MAAGRADHQGVRDAHRGEAHQPWRSTRRRSGRTSAGGSRSSPAACGRGRRSRPRSRTRGPPTPRGRSPPPGRTTRRRRRWTWRPPAERAGRRPSRAPSPLPARDGRRRARWPGRTGRSVHPRTVDRLCGMAQFIYTMQKVRKAVGDKVILDDVTLAFLPGAKIGVVGPNGAGKSTVLKLMAGLDTASNGDAKLTPGFSVGHPHAGARARRDQDGPRERGGRRPRGHRRDQALRGAEREDGRAGRRLRRDHGRAGAAARHHRLEERLGARQRHRAGHGRAALPAAGRAGDAPLRR